MNVESRVLKNTEFRPLRTGIICGGIFGVWLSFFLSPPLLKMCGIKVTLPNFALSTLAIVLMIELAWVLIYYKKYKET